MTFFNISHLSSFVPRSLPCDSAPSGSILFLHYCFAVRFVLGGGRAYHGLFDLLRTVVHVSCCCLLSIVYCHVVTLLHAPPMCPLSLSTSPSSSFLLPFSRQTLLWLKSSLVAFLKLSLYRTLSFVLHLHCISPCVVRLVD